MKNNRDRRSRKPTQGNIIGMFVSLIKGIWGSFSRLIGRLMHPNQGRRPTNPLPVQTKKVRATDVPIPPITGITDFSNAESITIGELIAKVQWRGQAPKSVPVPNIQSVRKQIDWD